MGCGQGTRAAALVLSAYPRPSRHADCGRRHCAQARDDRMAVLTDQEDFTWARPSLVAMKERRLQLQAGAARMRPAGPKGTRRCLQCESAARSRTQGRGERRAHLQSLCGALAAAEAESQDGSAAVEMTASSGLSISSVEPSRLFIHCPAQTKLQSDRLRVRRETIGKVSILNILDRVTQSISNIAQERVHMRSLGYWKRGSASRADRP